MADHITAVYDPATGHWSQDGLRPGLSVITVSRNPDARTEKYSGDPANPFTAKTVDEIAAYDAAQVAALVADRARDPIVVAVRETLQAALSTPAGHVSKLAFMRLLSPTEYTQFKALATRGEAPAVYALDILAAATSVNPNDPILLEALALAVQMAILPQKRADEILAAMASG